MPVLAEATDLAIHTIGTPTLWWATIAAVLILVTLDFIVTRKPHEVKLREAVRWTIFYIALPVVFGGWLWLEYGHDEAVKYYTGYVVEKSLSVDNLFVFILILSAFAVPKVLQQRVLLFGVVGALVLRGIFIWLGAELISRFDWTFLAFGVILFLTAIKVFRDAISQEDTEVDPDEIGVVKLMRRFFPVTGRYQGTHTTLIVDGRRHLTPLALVIAAVMFTDIVFAFDSVPAVFGITADPYLVFVTNAFALLGLRALYFVLETALSRLVHLGYGLSIILAFIGAKLVMHWAHNTWEWVPVIPTLVSLGVIIVVLTIVTITSLVSTRHLKDEPAPDATDSDGAAL